MPNPTLPKFAQGSTCADVSGRASWNAISLPGPGWTVIAMGPDYEHRVQYDWRNKIVRYRTPEAREPWVTPPQTLHSPEAAQYEEWGGTSPPCLPEPPRKGLFGCIVDTVMRRLK